MTPEERAADILRRCWWRPEDHPGDPRPSFNGLDEEIVAAIRAAVADHDSRWQMAYGADLETAEQMAEAEKAG